MAKASKKKQRSSPRTKAFIEKQNKKKSSPKLPVGRPSKYKKEYCKLLIDHQAAGYSFDTFAAIIDVNIDTLYEWVKKHRDFSDAKKRAYLVCMHWWEDQGIQGMHMPQQKWTPAILIYNMKCRFPKNWRDDPKGLDDQEDSDKDEQTFEAEW